MLANKSYPVAELRTPKDLQDFNNAVSALRNKYMYEVRQGIAKHLYRYRFTAQYRELSLDEQTYCYLVANKVKPSSLKFQE